MFKADKRTILSRGFQSSIGGILHFGIGAAESIEKLSIVWPDGKSQALKKVNANQQIVLDYRDARDTAIPASVKEPKIFSNFKGTKTTFRHRENNFDDFEKEILLPHKFSQNGPALAIGDVNGDGLEDFYIGGAKNQVSGLFIQDIEGSFAITK